MQIVGKTRLALSPFENHWWHCALYVTTRGVGTSPMPFGDRSLEVEFDFLNDALVVRTDENISKSVRLEDGSVADFFAAYLATLGALDVEIPIYPVPTEVPDVTPFTEDRAHSTYDADAARRWWRALMQADRALKAFRGRFAGKSSPSHLWWGGFDLACTRFSGRRAPPHPDVPYCPSYVTREAYSHECISAGWWPGTPGSPVADAAFYAYAYPEPAGCATARIEPPAARYDADLREWILPYESVRTASDPATMVAEFFESTYETAATLAGWDIEALRTSHDGADADASNASAHRDVAMDYRRQ
jgi:hypothetical protein